MLESFPRPRDNADAKAWFYLDRRLDIEAWAGLRSDAAELFDRYLITLAPDFERLADELDAEYDTRLNDGAKFRWLGLRRASWEGFGLDAATIGFSGTPTSSSSQVATTSGRSWGSIYQPKARMISDAGRWRTHWLTCARLWADGQAVTGPSGVTYDRPTG